MADNTYPVQWMSACWYIETKTAGFQPFARDLDAAASDAKLVKAAALALVEHDGYTGTKKPSLRIFR